MGSIHLTPAVAMDAFAVLDLAGNLYFGSLFPTYATAKQAADTAGMPAEIVRYSIPVAEGAERCSKCIDLVVQKHKETTLDIARLHEE